MAVARVWPSGVEAEPENVDVLAIETPWQAPHETCERAL